MTRPEKLKSSLDKWLSRTRRPRIAIVGDLILDRYTWGNAHRVSPEAPVLVLTANKEDARLGGAANVAAVAAALDADIALVGVVGTDSAADVIEGLLDACG